MKTLRSVAVVAGLVCILCCGRKSPDAQLVEAISPAAGWVPTLRMTAEKWLDNSVPPTFVGSTARAAQKEFEKAQEMVAESGASSELRKRIGADLRQANAFAVSLERAVHGDRRDGMAGEMLSLPPIQADLDRIEKQYGGGS